MNTTKIILGTFLLSSLFACSGAAISAPEDTSEPATKVDDPSAPAPSPSTPAPSNPAPSNPSNPSPPPPQTIAKHCNVSGPDVCVENAEGHAGDVVDVEVLLVGNGACTDALEASASMKFDPAKFGLANGADVVACRTRREAISALTNDPILQWSAFGASAVGGCPPVLPVGKTDVIEIWIRPGTPPGDYELTIEDAAFVSLAPACQTLGQGLAGTIRVLP